jgi:uncharacterized protein with PQ loop repeat
MLSINRQGGYYHHHRRRSRGQQSHRNALPLVAVTCVVLLSLLLSLLQQVNGFASTANSNMLGRAHLSPLLSFNKNHNHHHRRPIITTTTAAATTRLTTRTTPTMTTQLLMVPNEHLLRIAESYAPKFGIITSIFLYLAPAKVVWDIISKSNKSKSTKLYKFRSNNNNKKQKKNNTSNLDGLNPIPIAIMPCVAISWFIYGLVTSDPYIIIGNGVGSVLSIAYLIGILPLMNNNNNNKQLFWTQMTVLTSSITTLGLWSILGFLTSDTLSKSAVANGAVLGEALGIYASIFFIILCSSPLSTISKVIQTKNSSSILGQLTIAQCINTTLWSIYGLAVKDRFVYGPNIIVSIFLQVYVLH